MALSNNPFTSPKYLKYMRARTARIAVSASAARRQGAPGVILKARGFLAELDLRAFAVDEPTRFRTVLERATNQLRQSLPMAARSWGLSRKLLNIYLRDALYNHYLAVAYQLSRAEAFMEVPLDSITAARLKAEAPPRTLPAWPGVRHLDRESSDRYQEIARSAAVTHGFAPVHLDTLWWGARL